MTMRDLITWHHDYDGSTRQVARLGKIQVGAIITTSEYVQWIFWLPTNGTASPQWLYVAKPPKGEEQAKALVSRATLDWLTKASLLDLAERDRSHAASLPLFAESA